MEAIEFLKEAKRKCLSTPCDVCRDERLGVMCPLLEYSDEKLEQLVSGVEQWSKEHPIITNAQKFEEVFGSVPSHKISSSWTTTNPDNESRIMTEDYIGIKVGWWDEPYKEPEHEN